MLPAVNAQIESAVAQGYIIRGNGRLKSIVTITDGKLLVNGQPFTATKCGAGCSYLARRQRRWRSTCDAWLVPAKPPKSPAQ